MIRARPSGYFERVTSIGPESPFIGCLEAGKRTLASGDFAVQARRHWLRSLKRKVYAWFGQGWSNRLLEGFDELILKHENPVSRRI